MVNGMAYDSHRILISILRRWQEWRPTIARLPHLRPPNKRQYSRAILDCHMAIPLEDPNSICAASVDSTAQAWFPVVQSTVLIICTPRQVL